MALGQRSALGLIGHRHRHLAKGHPGSCPHLAKKIGKKAVGDMGRLLMCWLADHWQEGGGDYARRACCDRCSSLHFLSPHCFHVCSTPNDAECLSNPGVISLLFWAGAGKAVD